MKVTSDGVESSYRAFATRFDSTEVIAYSDEVKIEKPAKKIFKPAPPGINVPTKMNTIKID